MLRPILACLLALPVTAWADDPPPAPAPSDTELQKLAERSKDAEIVTVTGNLADSRGVAEEFFVLPDGIDAGARLRAITSDAGLGVGKIKLTDLALFDAHAEWAIARHFELDATATLLPKQPSATHERVFQGGSLTLRRDLFARTAIAVSAAASPLLGMKGEAFDGGLFVMHKHRLNEIVTFAMSLGANSTYLRPTTAVDHPYLFEGAGHAAVLVRIPNGMWGGWMGVGYALPVYQHGHDPVSAMPLDPQPRLDLDLGTAVQLAEKWDLAIELTILDRGDAAMPATQLPVLDGGFDQIQLTVGVSRRFDLGASQRQRGISDPLQQL